MRLIDADKLKEEVNNKRVVGRFNTILLIDNAPTVDTTFKEVVAYECGQKSVERPQGEWQLHGMIYYCSECGHECGESGDNFCGNCGADMRGGRE